jgi:hypothetical protein
MIAALLVACASVVGQEAVYLGRGGSTDGVTVSVDASWSRADELATRDGDAKDVVQSIGTAVVAYGTQAKILGRVDLETWDRGRLRRLPGYSVEILDGVLAGSKGVVSVRSTYKGRPRELSPPPVYKPKGKPLGVAWLGGEIEGKLLSPIVAASLDELKGVEHMEGKTEGKVRYGKAPIMSAQLGYGTKAEVFEFKDYRSEREGELTAAVVRILDGPAAGRIVYVDGDDVNRIEP